MTKVRVPFSQLPQQYRQCDWRKAMAGTFRRCDFTLGEEVALFEAAVAKWLGGGVGVVAVNSGTDAIKLALGRLKRGAEVIVPGNTFVATAGAVVEMGGVPVFCDVGDDYTIDVGDACGRKGPETAAAIPVHLYGHPCDMNLVMEDLAFDQGSGAPRIIEDAAQAFGAELDGELIGSTGQRVAFSLHPLKAFNVPGDGGFVAMRKEDGPGFLKCLRNHGLIDRDTATVFGVNSRLNTLCAAVARRQLPSLKGWLGRRREIAAMYDRAFVGDGVLADAIKVPPRRGKPSFHLYVVRARRRDALIRYLAKAGVEAKVHYPVPLHLQPAAKPYYRGPLPNVEAQAKEIISLPCHQYLTDGQVARVIEAVDGFYRRPRSKLFRPRTRQALAAELKTRGIDS